MLLAFIV